MQRYIEEVKSTLPESLESIQSRLATQYKLSPDLIETLLQEPMSVNFFERVCFLVVFIIYKNLADGRLRIRLLRVSHHLLHLQTGLSGPSLGNLGHVARTLNRLK